MRVAVLGASPKKDRYSNQAVNLLKDKGHEVIPVNPVYKEIDGIACVGSLKDIKGSVDTVSIYVGEVSPFISDILTLKPRRAIFNPGTENDKVENQLEAAGISCERACTLVLLRTGQF